jgi:hypothetical protein
VTSSCGRRGCARIPNLDEGRPRRRGGGVYAGKGSVDWTRADRHLRRRSTRPIQRFQTPPSFQSLDHNNPRCPGARARCLLLCVHHSFFFSSLPSSPQVLIPAAPFRPYSPAWRCTPEAMRACTRHAPADVRPAPPRNAAGDRRHPSALSVSRTAGDGRACRCHLVPLDGFVALSFISHHPCLPIPAQSLIVLLHLRPLPNTCCAIRWDRVMAQHRLVPTPLGCRSLPRGMLVLDQVGTPGARCRHPSIGRTAFSSRPAAQSIPEHGRLVVLEHLSSSGITAGASLFIFLFSIRDHHGRSRQETSPDDPLRDALLMREQKLCG